MGAAALASTDSIMLSWWCAIPVYAIHNITVDVFCFQNKMQVDQEEQKAAGDVTGDATPEGDDMTDGTGQNQVRLTPHSIRP